jgi:50S ribosomal protein L16 3-hydroxylase
MAADEKFNRFVQGVQNFAQRVFECPGQCDHRRCLDFHTTIVAVWQPVFSCFVFERGSFGLCNWITPMNTEQPLALLGGLSPTQFMRRHWQKKPLLVRNAIPGFVPCVGRNDLVALAAEEGVESRLILDSPKGWKMKHGPFPKRSLPPFSQKKWTFLLQGVDMHHDGVHALMQQFRFVPDARLDDVMISYASDGGGVGPHFDSYDVFLLQAHGQRRWRIGRQKDLSLQEGVPLKILQNFEAEEEFVLNPGDMLYLPPKYAHDGVAEGECMTWSIGFRAPQEGELARELLMGLADEAFEGLGAGLYRDPKQSAVMAPGAIPSSLAGFARQVVDKALQNPQLLDSLLGEYLTEPKAQVWFESTESTADLSGGVQLDRRTKMMYDAQHVFINGESFKVGGRDARVLRLLADDRSISGPKFKTLSADAQAALCDWASEGWLQAL